MSTDIDNIIKERAENSDWSVDVAGLVLNLVYPSDTEIESDNNKPNVNFQVQVATEHSSEQKR